MKRIGKNFKNPLLLWVIGAVNCLVTLAASAFAVVLALQRNWLVGIDEFVKTDVGSIVLISSAVALLSLNLAGLILRRRTLRYDTHIRYKTESGEVAIAINAINESLTRTVRSLAEVTDVRVSMLKERDEKKPIGIRAVFSTYEGTIIPDLIERIQQALKMRLGQIVDLPDTVSYDISLLKIEEKDVRKQESRKPISPQKESGEISFVGPQYPVGR